MKSYLLSLILLSAGVGSQDPQPFDVYDLRVEHLRKPLAVDATHPVFSWKLRSSHTEVRQKGYRLQVFEDSTALEAFWDSGDVLGGSPYCEYQGPPLQSHTRYYWKIQVADGQGGKTHSNISSFETGYFGNGLKGVDWLGDGKELEDRSTPYFRKRFEVKSEIIRAKLYIASRGLHHAEINGQKVGDEYLNPIFTKYDKRLFYNAYDVTPLVREGGNAVGVQLGNGWFNHQAETSWDFDQASWRDRPSFSAELYIWYQDGLVEVISTSDEWKIKESPYLFNSIYVGEGQDFTDLKDHWSHTGLDDAGWHSPQVVTPYTGHLEWQYIEPIRKSAEYSPVIVNEIAGHRVFVEFPQNISGIISMRLYRRQPQQIFIRHAEQGGETYGVLTGNIDGHYTAKGEELFQTDVLSFDRAGGWIEYTPKFSYKGFQLLELYSDSYFFLKPENIKAIELHSDVEPISTFETSNPVLNNIWEVANNSMLANLMGYPTDCPHREKNGWTGDGHIMAGSYLFNFDSYLTFKKWMADHRDSQRPDGNIPVIVPSSGWGYQNLIDWTVSTVLVPWQLYLFHGQESVLTENYQMMLDFMQYWEGKSKGLIPPPGIGDWKSPSSTFIAEFLSGVFYFEAAKTMANAASVLGRQTDADSFRALQLQIGDALHRKFFDPSTGTYGRGTQTEQSVALYFDLVPELMIERVADRLVESIVANDYKTQVGVVGAKTILPALCKVGQYDLAYRLATRTDHRSWGKMASSGSRTLHESWEFDPQWYGGSMNHMYFGAISEWFFRAIGGINPDPKFPGFEHIQLTPFLFTDLDGSSVTYESARGRIETSWERIDSLEVRYELSIPANSEAAFHIPPDYHIDQEELSQYDTLATGDLRLLSGSHAFTFRKLRDEVLLEETIDENIDGDKGKLYWDNRSLFYVEERNLKSEGMLRIFDSSGRVVLEKGILETIQGINELLAAEELNGISGLYLVQFVNHNQEGTERQSIKLVLR